MSASEPAGSPPAARKRIPFVGIGLLLLPMFVVLATFEPLKRRVALDFGDRWLLATDRWEGLDLDRLGWMLGTTRGGVRQPLAWLSFAAERLFSGDVVAGMHVSQVALHASSAAMVGALTYALLATTGAARLWRVGAPLTAGLVALAWGVHPLRVEPVATLAARGDLIATLFGVIAAAFWVKAFAGPKLSRSFLGIAAAASGLAALASPLSAAFVVGYWALGRWVARVRPDSRAAKGSLTWPLAFVALPAIVSFVATLAVRPADGPAPLAASVASLGHALVAPIWDTIWPAGLHPFHDPPPGFPDEVPAAWWMQTAIAALLAGRALPRARRGRGGSVALLACFAAAGVAWALGREPAGADRFTYAASVPLFVAVGVWIGEGAGCVLWFFGAPLVAVLVVIPGWMSRGLTRAWTDEATLSAHVLALDPANDRVHAALGDAARRRGASALAAAEYERSLAGDAAARGSARPYAEAGLGALALDEGDVDRAAAHLERATTLARWRAEPHVLLGVVRTQQGKLDLAVQALESAVRLDDASPAAWFALGRARAARGDRHAAADAFRRAVALDPQDARTREELERLEQ